MKVVSFEHKTGFNSGGLVVFGELTSMGPSIGTAEKLKILTR